MFYNLKALFFDVYSEDGSGWVNAKGVFSLCLGTDHFAGWPCTCFHHENPYKICKILHECSHIIMFIKQVGEKR